MVNVTVVWGGGVGVGGKGAIQPFSSHPFQTRAGGFCFSDVEKNVGRAGN